MRKTSVTALKVKRLINWEQCC